MTLTWWLLIRRVFFPKIDDIVDPADAYMAALYWLSLNFLDHGGVLSSLFYYELLNTCIHLYIATSGIHQYKLLFYYECIVLGVKCRN
jgi:hypothetical protein